MELKSSERLVCDQEPEDRFCEVVGSVLPTDFFKGQGMKVGIGTDHQEWVVGLVNDR